MSCLFSCPCYMSLPRLSSRPRYSARFGLVDGVPHSLFCPPLSPCFSAYFHPSSYRVSMRRHDFRRCRSYPKSTLCNGLVCSVFSSAIFRLFRLTMAVIFVFSSGLAPYTGYAEMEGKNRWTASPASLERAESCSLQILLPPKPSRGLPLLIVPAI